MGNRAINKQLFGASAFSLAVLTALPSMAEAQVGEGNRQQIDDIVVTARKREESLMSVPVAVTAIGSEQLQNSGSTDLGSISQMAPQVVVGRSDSGSGASFSIRGIGTSFFDSGTEQSVSVNIDGIAAGRGNIITQGFFDLEQVEVMKGPQALFFGKNSPAGVISLHSVNPTDRLEGYVRAGYEFNARERYVEAAIGGAITDTLKGRIALRGSKMRGWLINTAAPTPANPFYAPGLGTRGAVHKGNGGEDILGRLTLIYTPSSAFNATLKVSAGKHEDNGTAGQAICDPTGGLTVPTVSGVPDPSGDCSYNKYFQNSAISPDITANWPNARDGVPYTDTWSTLTSLTMNYNMPNLTLTSVTGFFKLKHRQMVDFTYSSYGSLMSALGEDTRQWSEELRLVSDYDGPLNFTMGGYFEDSKRTNPTSSMLAFLGPDAATGKFNTYDNFARVTSQTLSGFAQLRWAFLDGFELAGGARYSRDKKSVATGNTYIHSTFPPILRPAGDLLRGQFRDSNWSPEITLSWKPRTGLLVFGAYKTGYKAGGFSNPSLLSAFQGLDVLSFGSETIKGFEGGVKADLFDRTARIELTAYNYDYKNLQVSVFDQSTFQYFILNAPSSRIKGLELSGQWRPPVNGLALNGSVSYNSARYTDFPSFLCYTYQTRATGCTMGGTVDPLTGIVTGGRQDLTGQSLSRAPKWTLSGGFTYDTAIGNGLNIALNADANYTGKYDAGEDKAPILRQKAYTLINAGARLYADSGWELAFIGRNLTNRYYKYAGSGKSYGSPYEYLTYTPRTREYRVQATYRF